MKISLCIPTMDRWDFLNLNLPKYLENYFLDEIIICDENGNDTIKINENFSDKKIKTYVNEYRIGAFYNKEKVVSLAKNKYVCLMDSDNFAPISYFECWQKEFKSEDNIVYCPCRTFPQSNHKGFDFRKLISKDINKENYKDYFKINQNFFNTGNYIFEKNFYLNSQNKQYDYRSICCCLDVLYKNWLMLENGATFVVINNMEYDHVVHDGSYWRRTNHKMPRNDVNLINNLYK